MKAYMSIEKVGITFQRGAASTEVLRDVSLQINQGEYIAIIGHSGCGKSTLLNIVAGLLDSTTGEVFVDGDVVREPGPDRAVVFQNHSLLPWLTTYENVRLAVDKVFRKTKTAAERHDWTMHNLDLVQMAQAKDKRPAEISGGMKQRVGLARALAMQPKVLLLDEPFRGMDSLTRSVMHESLLRFYDRAEVTVLFITHDIDEAVFLGTRVSVMTSRPGRIKETIDVPLDRPRELSVVATGRFQEIAHRVGEAVEDEARHAFAVGERELA